MRVRTLKMLSSTMLVAGLLALAACVTINVYFPAAEAQQAAQEFVGKVIGNDSKPADQPETPQNKPPSASVQPGFNLMSLLINDAVAAESANMNIHTPAIQAIQDRMAGRFHGSLETHFDDGALGFGNDGLIVVRDATKIGLKDRVAVNQQVADDNRDRKAVYRELAVANNHPEWEGQIRDTFVKEWVAQAHKGWWYQSGDGAWKQK